MLSMKRPPLPEAVVSIKVDTKKLRKYVELDNVLLDIDGNPIVRVVWIKEEKKRTPRSREKSFEVGVRFLEKPHVSREL